MRNCLIWTFLGIAIAGGRAHRFSNHAHFNVRIHDGVRTQSPVTAILTDH
jgi:hypothetical protein